MIIFLNVRELEIDKHETFEYIITIIYFTEIFMTDKKLVREMIRREIYLVNNLKINMLIENDILNLEDIFLDDVNNKTTMFSCNMIISIEIRILSKKKINKTLHAWCITIISSYSMMIIFIHSDLLTNRDFHFEFVNLNIFLFVHTIDSFITIITTKNDFEKLIKISRNDRLEVVIEIQYSNVFAAIVDIQDYAKRKSRRAHKISWFFRIFKTALIVYIVVLTTLTFISKFSTSQNTIFSNDVIIYNSNSQTIVSFSKLIDQYSDL
jgi:hypothetical protein